MKKVVILLFCVFLLQACADIGPSVPKAEQENEQKLPSDIEIVEKTSNEEIPTILLDNSAFHSLVGWLSNEEIVIIVAEKGQWLVKLYTVPTNSWRTIYTTTTPIIQGTIHPSKEMILLHTSKDSSSAEIQFLHKNGYVLQSLSFESAEIYMDWHPTNPNLVVFSTFYEDWTYSTFVYDLATQELTSIEIENPFVKWYDEENLMVFRWSDSGLDGSELLLYSILDETLKSTGEEKVLDATNIGEAIVYVQINEEEKQFEYRIEDLNGRKFEWATPAVSNYSEWIIPSMSIVSPTEVILLNAKESRNQDDASQKSILSKISIVDQQQIFGEIEEQPISCSPNAEICLGGYAKENWIQTNSLDEKKWIYFNE
ncbi:hypothetical protein [Psychrobacillus sp. BM2]|uniref:YqgU-like beta propeller domain-containing protein n=1 Tax=Psychrobacillus sp. BM2 TaxID=3400421 RepID=UPI003B029363